MSQNISRLYIEEDVNIRSPDKKTQQGKTRGKKCR